LVFASDLDAANGKKARKDTVKRRNAGSLMNGIDSTNNTAMIVV
jgi:hypothetical protein